VLPGLPSNEKNSSDHHNSYNKGPNLALCSFTESPSNSLPTTKFPKNYITYSYYMNLPKTTNATFVHQRALGVKAWPKLRIIMFWVWTWKQVTYSIRVMYKTFTTTCFMIYISGFIIWVEERRLFLYVKWRTHSSSTILIWTSKHMIPTVSFPL
jgi:hypothetical protein